MAGNKFSELCRNYRWVLLRHQYSHRTVAGGYFELGPGQFYLTHVFVWYLHVPVGNRHETVLSSNLVSSPLAHKLPYGITGQASDKASYNGKDQGHRHDSTS